MTAKRRVACYGSGECATDRGVLMPKSKLPGSDRMKRPSIRVEEDLLDRFDEWCERNDTNRSEAIRKYMARCVAELDDTTVATTPEDPRLKRAYRAMKRASAPDGTIPTSGAKSRIAEETRLRHEDVKRVVLRPLDERGFLTAHRNGVLQLTTPGSES